MPQKRFYNYDSNADSVSENAINYGLHTPGVYRGLDITITVDNKLTLSTGYGLQPSGVVWTEDTAVTLPFTPPAVATSYTIVATHENRLILGGVEVIYDIQTGVLVSIPNGVVLGWVYHPGGGLPLIQDYVVSVPKELGYSTYVSNTLPKELIPQYPGTLVTFSGLDITFVPQSFDPVLFITYQEVSNSAVAPGVEQLIQIIQLYVNNSIRPSNILFYFYCDAPAATNLEVEVYGTDLLPATVSGSPFIGSGAWEYKSVAIDRLSGTFEDGKPYTVRLTYNVDKGKAIRLGRILVGYWPFPTVP